MNKYTFHQSNLDNAILVFKVGTSDPISFEERDKLLEELNKKPYEPMPRPDGFPENEHWPPL